MNLTENHKIGYSFAVGSAFCYAIQVIMGKYILSNGIAPYDLLLIQYTCTTVILGLFLLCKRNKALFQCSKRNLVKIAVQGIFGAAGTSLFLYQAMDRIDASIASMLLYLCPVYVCLFFILTKIKKIGLSNKFAVVISFVGALLVLDIFPLKNASISFTGVLLGALAGVSYAFYNIFADLKLREIPTETLLFYMYIFATATVYIINPGFFFHLPHFESTSILLVVCISALFQVTPMAFLNLAIRSIGSDKSSVITTAELPFTVLLAYFILAEALMPVQIIGIIIIVGALLLLQVKK